MRNGQRPALKTRRALLAGYYAHGPGASNVRESSASGPDFPQGNRIPATDPRNLRFPYVGGMTGTKLDVRARRWAAVAALVVLSPICAEYLIGYLEGADEPLGLLAGLLILAPLYGTVAVLIREVVRRTGRGWPTILLSPRPSV